MTTPDTPLSRIIGGTTAKALEKSLGLISADDLFRHYPRRYAERGELSDLSSLVVDQYVTVMAEILRVTTRQMAARRGSLTEVVISDGQGTMSLTFFKQPYRERELRPGRRGLFSGKVGSYRGTRQLTHPDYLLLPDEDDVTILDESAIAGVDTDTADAFANALIPVYPSSGKVTTWMIGRAVALALHNVDDIPDPLPPDIRLAHGLVSLRDAYQLIHEPKSRNDIAIATKRLRWEEAFVLQTVLAQRSAAARAMPAVARNAVEGGLVAAFDSRLPFVLTAGQVEVGEVLSMELARVHPMHRLLQGEVGSGKTVVALRAMLAVVDAGGQAALLAPTEVLAHQHERSITNLLGPLAQRGLLGGSEIGTRVTLLTGSQSTATRRKAMLDVVSGEAGIVIGTHALLQEKVEFHDLGFIVVDEQHRFGVEQRAALAAKSRDDVRPHVLVMTATPIPRTIAMTVFGDLDVSTLAEMPVGRSPIETHVVPALERPNYIQRTWARIVEEVRAGRQAYVVCPRIGEQGSASEDVGIEFNDGPIDDDLDAGFVPESADTRPPRSVLETVTRLREGPLADVRVEVMHGRMSSEDKDAVMHRFYAGPDAADGIDVLVSTTVIEVGVDVPNATVMVVLDAERFGVSQLHQLRGRVGRGTQAGLCLLVTDAPVDSAARTRLEDVAGTLDGFALSELDLKNRREGDVLGAVQSGRKSSLKLLSVLRDGDVIADAREQAIALIHQDPQLSNHAALREFVARLVDDEHADFLEKS